MAPRQRSNFRPNNTRTKEMEAEKIRLEKLEKEKYFNDLYFDTKTKEIEVDDDVQNNFDLINEE